jgi:hypothetical protein
MIEAYAQQEMKGPSEGEVKVAKAWNKGLSKIKK